PISWIVCSFCCSCVTSSVCASSCVVCCSLVANSSVDCSSDLCSSFLSSFFSSFLPSFLTSFFASFVSSFDVLSSFCPHAPNTNKLANNKNNNFFISHSPFLIYIYIIHKNMKKKTVLPKIKFRKNDINVLTSEKPWCKVVIKTSEMIQK